MLSIHSPNSTLFWKRLLKNGTDQNSTDRGITFSPGKLFGKLIEEKRVPGGTDPQ